MVMKKKGLYLGLLLSLLGMGNVMQANRLTIKNETPRNVTFKVSYYNERKGFCWPDEGELASGKRKDIRSGFCVVKKVEAELRHPRTSGGKRFRPLRIKIERKGPSGKAGNTTWIIKGPFDGHKYKIVGGLDK